MLELAGFRHLFGPLLRIGGELVAPLQRRRAYRRASIVVDFQERRTLLLLPRRCQRNRQKHANRESPQSVPAPLQPSETAAHSKRSPSSCSSTPPAARWSTAGR